jgi:hypothetical protein
MEKCSEPSGYLGFAECVGGRLLSGVFTAVFGLDWRTRYAASVRYAYRKDDGKSVRIFVPTKFNHLFHDS